MFWNKMQALSSRFDQLQFVSMTFLGLGCIRLWLLNLSAGELTQTPLTASDFGTLFRVTQIVALLVFAQLARRIHTLHRNGVFSLGAVCSLIVSTIILWLGQRLTVNALAICGCILGAAGYAAMLVLWLELYGCLTSRNMVIAYAGSNILAALLWQFLSPLNTTFARILIILLPAISAFCLLRGFMNPLAQREAFLSSSQQWQYPRITSYWRLLLWIGCFSFTAGFFSSPALRLGVTLGYIISGMLVLLVIIVCNKNFDSTLLYRVSLPFIILGLVIAPVIPSDAEIIRMLISTGKELALTIALVVACNTSYHKKVSAAYFGGWVYAINIAGLWVGEITRGIISIPAVQAQIPRFACIIIICLACLIASTIIFNDKHFIAHWSAVGLPAEHESSAAARQMHAMLRMSADFGLSPREEEIVTLMAQGKSTAEIGTELFIAPGTVRAHISRIYGKLGVHDRDSFTAIIHDYGLV